MIKLVIYFFDYFIVPLVSIITFFIVGMWWKNMATHDLRSSFFLACFFLLIFVDSALKGYKRYYLNEQRIYYFCITFIFPLIISVLGFVYGLVTFGKQIF